MRIPFLFFRKWWHKVESSALSPEFSIKENARIRLFNRLCLGVVPANMIVAFLNLFVYQDFFATALIGMVLLSFFMGFFQSRAGRYTLSRWLVILPIIVILDILTCTYGRTAGGSISFLIIGVATVILFEKRIDRMILLGILGGSFIFTEWYISTQEIDMIGADIYGIFPPLTFTINFFIMVMILLYFEEFLQRSRKETEVLLEDITLQNESLTQTNYELAHFANTASHHFQSPLRNISAMLSMMERTMPEQVPSSARVYMDLIKGDAKQLYQFVEDILMYARIGQGEAWKAGGVTQLKDVAVSAAHTINLDQERVHIHSDVSLPVHPDHLHLVLVNLFDNAVKYSKDQPQILVEVSKEPLTRESSVNITISDNGIGISPEYHGQVFEMFSRLHTHDQIPGSGIGLAVCKRVMKEYGGTITLVRSNGNGSVFRLTFPRSLS